MTAVARPRIAEELGISPCELAGLHRRFEIVPTWSTGSLGLDQREPFAKRRQ
ncbi:hypothetical protein GT025_19555 [Streptomyces sp. SID4920]|nr:hypothetical protein [Streptomyces sp. SID4920]MYX63680.1 hypothetical protein [Streptomyces sp. SID8373]